MIEVKQNAVFEDEYGNVVIKVYKDGKIIDSVKFEEGEIEDNTLGRNFSDVFNILGLMELVYEAGKRGEEIKFEKTEEFK